MMAVYPSAPQDQGYAPNPDPARRQSHLVEYEILDSFWTHQHQWIWLSAVVLITLSMLGMTFLPVSLTSHALRVEIVSFVAVIAVTLTFIWWGLLRQMLKSLSVVQHRKREIERNLGMRMEIYMSAARTPRKRQRIREIAHDQAGEDTELRADLADFLRSSSVRPGLLPGEDKVWNILPLFFIVAWMAFWVIVAGPAVFSFL